MAQPRDHVSRCIQDARAAIARSDYLQASPPTPEIAELRSALRAIVDAIKALNERAD